MGINTKNSKTFPNVANAFSRVLNTVAPSILSLGYEIVTRQGYPRKIIITPNKQTTLNKVENKAPKPKFMFKDIPPAEKCDCGKFAVTKEIVTPQGDTMRRCTDCFESLRSNFTGADWRQGYAEMLSFEEAEEES